MVGCWKIFSDLVSDSGSEPYSMSVEICKIFYKYLYNTKGQCDKNEKPIKMCSLNWNWLELELVPLLFHQWPSIWDRITLTHVVIIVTLIILNWIELNLLVSFVRSTPHMEFGTMCLMIYDCLVCWEGLNLELWVGKDWGEAHRSFQILAQEKVQSIKNYYFLFYIIWS